MELVVWSQCWKSSCADGVGKEDLSGRINPGLRVGELGPVWSDVTNESGRGPLKGDSSDEEDGQHKVGEQSREPDDLEVNLKLCTIPNVFIVKTIANDFLIIPIFRCTFFKMSLF